MSSTVLYMSMSLDGFIAGPNEHPGNGLGDGGVRLHQWVLPGKDADDLDAKYNMLVSILQDDTTPGPVTSKKNVLMQQFYRGE